MIIICNVYELKSYRTEKNSQERFLCSIKLINFVRFLLQSSLLNDLHFVLNLKECSLSIISSTSYIHQNKFPLLLHSNKAMMTLSALYSLHQRIQGPDGRSRWSLVKAPTHFRPDIQICTVFCSCGWLRQDSFYKNVNSLLLPPSVLTLSYAFVEKIKENINKHNLIY